jgi:hypothetical protein
MYRPVYNKKFSDEKLNFLIKNYALSVLTSEMNRMRMGISPFPLRPAMDKKYFLQTECYTSKFMKSVL